MEVLDEVDVVDVVDVAVSELVCSSTADVVTATGSTVVGGSGDVVAITDGEVLARDVVSMSDAVGELSLAQEATSNASRVSNAPRRPNWAPAAV